MGNGDISSVRSADTMLTQTRCDALMIGRAAVTNPFIFQEINSYYSGIAYTPTKDTLFEFVTIFSSYLPVELSEVGKTKLYKQLFRFLYKKNDSLKNLSKAMLSQSYLSSSDFVSKNLPTLLANFFS